MVTAETLKGEFHGSAHVRSITQAQSSQLFLDQLEASTQHRRDTAGKSYNLLA